MQNIHLIAETIEGYKVKSLRWDAIANIIVGQVKCPIWGRETLYDGYVSCNWKKNGKPTLKFGGNKRLDLTLKLE